MNPCVWLLALTGLWLVTDKLQAAGADVPDLPASLAQWYKPQNRRQVFLHRMFALRREMLAVRDYAAQQDWPHLQRWARRLADDYRQIGNMVPEWRGELDLDRLAELERAVEDADPAAVDAAARHLGRSCRGCHGEYRALVALRYRTPDFRHLEVVENQADTRYPRVMTRLVQDINRIRIAAEDGRWPAASKSLRQLRQELDRLGSSCAHCHRDAEPKARILGAQTQQALDRLQQAVEEQNGQVLGRRLGEVAVRVCARCHGVHKLGSDLRQRLFD